MADAFHGGFGASTSKPHGIFLKLPHIPLWVATEARNVLNNLVLATIKLALQEVAGRVSDEAGKFADTGNLAQSFGADPATSTGGIELAGGQQVSSEINGRVFSSLPYAIVMESGRRPGAPISRLGIDAIGLWAQRKLGLSAEKAAHVKYAIAAHIVAQGIEGKGYFEDGVNTALPRVNAMFQILSDQLAAALVKPGAGQTGTA